MKSKYEGSTWFGMTREDFDSDEELLFWCWLKEAECFHLVSNIKFHPYVFKLFDKASIKFEQHMKTKTKVVDKFILHKHSYTPDFEFCINSHLLRELNILVENPGTTKYMVVDVKGGYSKFGDTKQFSINQKWVYAKLGVYVQKIVPFKLFRKSFGPAICLFTPKTRKPNKSKDYKGLKSINEFMEV